MRCLVTAHDTHEGGPVPPQRPSLRQKNRSPQLFCKRLSSPVLYLDDASFEFEMQNIIERITANEDFLRVQSRETVVEAVFNMFKFAALCTKHPGFFEEREWRVIYTPQMGQSPHVRMEIESVNGIPQPICKFALREIPDIGYFGIEIPALLDRIIVGPTEYPNTILEAFITLLADAGVQNPVDRVHMTGIPSLLQNS